MCGFVGTVSRHSITPDAVAATRRVTDLLIRRGPDDAGHESGDWFALGFRRLAVLDLTPAGHQPMTTDDGRWTLVFNGELYNHVELRRQLVAEGARFHSASDSEVVLQALVHWGEGALRRFNAMFALALVDRRDRTVLLARDPMGIKPLAWMECPQGLVFSSQYDAVIRHPWCDRQRIRPDVAALYLRLGYVPSPYGIVEGTGQVAPGSLMRWSAERGLESEAYWRWPDAPRTRLGPDDGADALRIALGDAVDRQLAADVPVGTFLSGGIDSPLVTAIAQGHQPHLPAFTIGTEDASLDETQQAGRYAGHLGVEHVVRTISEDDALALFDQVIGAYGEPFGDFSAFPTLLVSRLARERVTVCLSGDGGDELFFGYPRMWTALRWRRLFHLPPLARRGIRRALGPWPSIRPNEGSTIGSLGDLVLTPHSEFGGAALSRVAPGLGGPPNDFTLYDLDEVPSEDDLAQWLRRNEIAGHLEKMLLKVDRASMHESLEVRVPLLDLDVVAAAVSIDPGACIGGGVGKLPLRRELARHVPPSMISTPKKGFSVPLGDWFRGGLAERLRDRVVEHPVILGDAFDRNEVQALIDTHDAGADHTRPLWHLLSLQEWADRHLRPLDD